MILGAPLIRTHLFHLLEVIVQLGPFGPSDLLADQLRRKDRGGSGTAGTSQIIEEPQGQKGNRDAPHSPCHIREVAGTAQNPQKDPPKHP